MRARTLKWWNGNLSHNRHGYVCAYSQADAVALIKEKYGSVWITLGYFRDYWSNCAGDAMKGIEPSRGLWVENEEFGGKSKPVKQ